MPAECFFKDNVKRSHDVQYDRLRRVIDSSPFPCLWIVFGKKSFVEMYYRVVSFAFIKVLMKDVFDICDSENFGDVVNRRLELLGRIERNEVEDVAKNANGLGNQIVSDLTVECSVGTGSRSEESISDCLRVKVSKLVGFEIGDQMLLEGLIETKNPFCPNAGCLAEFFFDDLISQEACACCKFFRKTLGGELCRKGELKEFFQQSQEFRRVFCREESF